MANDFTITEGSAASAPASGNLLAARIEIYRTLGRADLVDSSGVALSTKANSLVNNACRWLDRRFDHIKSTERYLEDIPVGSAFITPTGLRSVEHVWVYAPGTGTLDQQVIKLAPLTLTEFRETYPDIEDAIDSGSTVDTALLGTPAHFAQTFIGVSAQLNDSTDLSTSITGDFHDTVLGNHFGKGGILFAPPNSEAMTISVYGHFYSKTLTSDSDLCFWTAEHMDLLTFVMGYLLEVQYRNTEGANNWKREIMEYARGLDNDLVDARGHDINQMVG